VAAGGLDACISLIGVSAFFLEETDRENTELPIRAPGEDDLKEDINISEE
jgi:hypothetical protein